MTDETVKKRRPSHETIADAVARVLHPDELDNWGKFLMETDIPAGHDAIIASLQGKRFRLGLSVNDEVVADLLEQKAAAEAKEKAKKEKEAVSS